jgi:hypothetical protein
LQPLNSVHDNVFLISLPPAAGFNIGGNTYCGRHPINTIGIKPRAPLSVKNVRLNPKNYGR